MEKTTLCLPLAREEGLVIEEIADEVLVYDLDRHKAHSLNRVAALVWRHCNGNTTLKEMANLLRSEVNEELNEEAVWVALTQLEKARLLRERLVRPAELMDKSRREALKKLAMVGGTVLVASIVAPTAAHAASACAGLGQPCIGNGSGSSACCAGLHCSVNGNHPGTCLLGS